VLIASDIKNINTWKRLLHYSKDYNKEIIDQSFYMTNSSNIYDEIYAFRNEISQPDGFQVACQFPARYELLVKTFKDVIQFNLDNCRELNFFLKDLTSKKISLLMTSELLNAPASAFGHILLVLHNEDKPELHSNVIHFSAITKEGESFFTYIFKGLTGGYDGYYIRNKYFEKKQEYSVDEQRYIFLYELDLKHEQKKTLLYHLFELRKARFEYYFLNENCGYRLDNLISIIYEKDFSSNLLFTLPQETLSRFSDKFNKRTKVIPLANIAKENIHKLNEREKNKFKKIVKGDLIVTGADSTELKDAVKSYYLYSFRRNNIALPNYNENVSYHMISSDYTVSDKLIDPLDKSKPSKLSSGVGIYRNESYLSLKFRAALIEIENFQKNSLHESELSILSTSVLVNNRRSYIQEIDLVSVKLLPQSEDLFESYSWQGNLSINRFNPTNSNALAYKAGVGKTLSKFGQISILVNVGGDHNEKFNSLYLSPEFKYILYYSKVKFLIGYENKIYQKKNLGLINSGLSYYISKNYELNYNYQKTTTNNSLSTLNISYFY
jgi:hypothetical protein